MTRYVIPGLYEHFNLNTRLLMLMQKFPDYFYDDIKIEACYGDFQFCIFDGGRIFSHYQFVAKEDIEQIIQIFNNEYNVSGRLIFTNNKLTPDLYYNRFGNVVLQICHNEKNGIVLNDDNFMDWIHKEYPLYYFVSSTTKCLTDPTLAQQELELDQFKAICLDYNLNKNFDFLQSLSNDIKPKTEFLINAICPPKCPNRQLHYNLNSLYHLSYGQHLINPKTCGIKMNTLHPIARNYKNTISLDEINTIYKPMGFELMKIEGRSLSDIEVGSAYVYYMVKKQYQDFLKYILLKDLSPIISISNYYKDQMRIKKY